MRFDVRNRNLGWFGRNCEREPHKEPAVKRILTLCAAALAPAAALLAASPSVAYYKGDTVYASTQVAYCKSIRDLQTYVSLRKAKANAEAGQLIGCGMLDKDAKAIAVNISFHGYARVILQTEGAQSAKVYVQKTRWWTREEESYFGCMRQHEDDAFADAHNECLAKSVSQ